MLGLLLSGIQGNQSKLQSTHSIFYGNAAETGGAIFVTQADITDFKSDFRWNTASLAGGAVHVKVSIGFLSWSKNSDGNSPVLY